jgi:hypothetical protein
MPKRSNDFQRLIYLIKQQLSPEAIVTESKELVDLLSQTGREVDICIETVISTHPIIICVECQDRSRKSGIGWIEEMKAKHERLSTNKLVLVSRKGFTPEARTISAKYGIELLQFDELTESSIQGVFGHIDEVWLKQSRIETSKIIVHVLAKDKFPEDTVDASHGHVIYHNDGRQFGELRTFLDFFFKPGEILNNILVRAEDHHEALLLTCEDPKFADGTRPCMLKLDESHLREIDWIKVVARISFVSSTFRLSHATFGDTRVSWGNGNVQGEAAVLVASEDSKGEKRIAVKSLLD